MFKRFIHRRAILAVAVGVTVVALACAQASGSGGPAGRDDTTDTPQATEPTEDTGTPITSIDDIDPDKCNLIHNINACFADGEAPADIPMSDYFGLFMQAQEDLGQRLGVDIAYIKLAEVERVDWPDTALGSPQPGMMYAQVITPGFKMVLDAEGERYTYHTSMERVVFVGGGVKPLRNLGVAGTPSFGIAQDKP